MFKERIRGALTNRNQGYIRPGKLGPYEFLNIDSKDDSCPVFIRKVKILSEKPQNVEKIWNIERLSITPI